MTDSSRDAHPPADWPTDVTHDRLIGDVSIYQRKGGHRTGTDDVLTAYYATHRRPGACPSYLDLGCGIGSVLLMVAHRLRPAECVGVEAQSESFTLASRAVAELPEGFPRVRLVHADFRGLDLGRRFAVVTGSPPYFPTHAGVLPQDPQRLACRFEVRGGVEAYCLAAARHLEPEGRFFVVHQTVHEPRVLTAAAGAGLHLRSCLDARMRTDRAAPFLTVYEFGLAAVGAQGVLSPSDACPARAGLSIRGADGAFTKAYTAARRELGVDAAP
ncbi:MAG: methyltransferase domain-containing protein [Sandaracinaceae bacterium]|nr:methyltransferase domain-containing protein [Myxococcales bacterium]MCB9662353.1 methyltransferase domain-containing protein [Sandaracinaceae bacterium]